MWNVTNRSTDQGDDYAKGYLPHYQNFRQLEVVVSIARSYLLLLDLRAAALVADAGMKKAKTKTNNATTHVVSKQYVSKSWKHKKLEDIFP